MAVDTKRLPDVMEQRLHTFHGDKIAMLLDEAAALANIVKENIPDDEYDPMIHHARRLAEIKEELMEIQAAEGLEALRHNRIVYRAYMVAGRETVKMEKFKEELVNLGVSIDVVMKALKAATTDGHAFWKQEIKILKDKE